MKKSLLFLLLAVPALCFGQIGWTQRADVGGFTRADAFVFTIGNYAYIGTGISLTNGQLNDVWQWDQVSDSWSQAANYPGLGRRDASSFGIGNYGYVGLGYGAPGSAHNDFWKYDPATNHWTSLGAFPGGAREEAASFATLTAPAYGYVACGTDGDTVYTDLWQYNAASNQWTQKADFPGGERNDPCCFAISHYGYVGLGKLCINNSFVPDFYQYDVYTDSWVRIADYAGLPRNETAAFSIGNKGYVGTGFDSVYAYFTRDFYEWDQATDTWTQIADLPGPTRGSAVGFSLNGKGYVATGNETFFTCYYYGDLWEYGPANNVGIEEHSSPVLEFYPNPAISEININTSIKGPVTISVFDAGGKTVLEKRINLSIESTLDVSSLANGTYYLQVLGDKTSIRKQFVKVN